MRYLILMITLITATATWAAPVDTFQFETETQEKTFRKLSDELRCLVCQNQNLTDSNSGLAKDLRTEVYNMILDGKTEKEIVDFMVQRYGDYVLYRPPVKPLTWILWFGPVILFIGGVIYAIRIVRSRENNDVVAELSPDEDERLKNIRAESNIMSQDKEGRDE